MKSQFSNAAALHEGLWMLSFSGFSLADTLLNVCGFICYLQDGAPLYANVDVTPSSFLPMSTDISVCAHFKPAIDCLIDWKYLLIFGCRLPTFEGVFESSYFVCFAAWYQRLLQSAYFGVQAGNSSCAASEGRGKNAGLFRFRLES